ncbi:TPA: p53-induced protein-like [Bos taurus]|nr:TPA: p53-induced protein-like [Bos taurus]
MAAKQPPPLMKKHSQTDLVSRLKTRKILGVGGEDDDGEVHRSKISQVLGNEIKFAVREPLGLRVWQFVSAVLFSGIAIMALAFPDQLYDAVFDGAQVTSKTPIRLYGGALLSEYCWADAWKGCYTVILNAFETYVYLAGALAIGVLAIEPTSTSRSLAQDPVGPHFGDYEPAAFTPSPPAQLRPLAGGGTALSLRALVHPLRSHGRAAHPSLAGLAWPCSSAHASPFHASIPPLLSAWVSFNTAGPEGMARQTPPPPPQKAWVSFNTAGPEGVARQTPPPPPKGCTDSGPAWDSVEGQQPWAPNLPGGPRLTVMASLGKGHVAGFVAAGMAVGVGEGRHRGRQSLCDGAREGVGRASGQHAGEGGTVDEGAESGVQQTPEDMPK